MKINRLAIQDVVLIEPTIFRDARGFFLESYHQKKFEAILPPATNFVQDNHSRSHKNVLRGLHFQSPHAQGKLVRVGFGEIFDVAVDLRRDSPDFGRAVAAHLSSENGHMMWIPPGFAHGFLALSDLADVLYKTTDFWHGEAEHSLAWNDPDLAIDWPLQGQDPILSAKDAAAKSFALLSAQKII